MRGKVILIFACLMWLAQSASLDAAELKMPPFSDAGKSSIQSEITTADENDNVRKHPCKIWTTELKKCMSYQIDMIRTQKESNLDPYLRLENASGTQLAQDDDSGGYPNARIKFDCPADGTYRIIATTYDGSLGKFSLEVTQIGKSNPLVKGVVIKLKEHKPSRLTTSDPRDRVQKKSYCKVFTIDLQAKQKVHISMASRTFVSLLRLEDASGKQLDATNPEKIERIGDLPGTHLDFTPPEAGIYRIVATTYLGGIGDFILSVDPIVPK